MSGVLRPSGNRACRSRGRSAPLLRVRGWDSSPPREPRHASGWIPGLDSLLPSLPRGNPGVRAGPSPAQPDASLSSPPPSPPAPKKTRRRAPDRPLPAPSEEAPPGEGVGKGTSAWDRGGRVEFAPSPLGQGRSPQDKPCPWAPPGPGATQNSVRRRGREKGAIPPAGAATPPPHNPPPNCPQPRPRPQPAPGRGEGQKEGGGRRGLSGASGRAGADKGLGSGQGLPGRDLPRGG